MILLLALAAAFVLAYLRGGRFSNLSSLPLRGSGLVLAAFMIQAAIVYLTPTVTPVDSLRVELYALSYILLGAFVIWNRHISGVWVLGLGLVANAAVILANGGYMPMTYEALVATGKSHMVTGSEPGTYLAGSKDILLPLQATRLWFLSDIFVIPPPFPIPSVFSIGDAIIALGLLWFVPCALGAGPAEKLAGSAPLR